jgi:hypothetical protein
MKKEGRKGVGKQRGPERREKGGKIELMTEIEREKERKRHGREGIEGGKEGLRTRETLGKRGAVEIERGGMRRKKG